MTDKYSAFVRANPAGARQLEDYVRLASFLLPSLLGAGAAAGVAGSSIPFSSPAAFGGGGVGEALGEALSSIANLLGLAHDTLLARGAAAESDPAASPTARAVSWALSALAGLDVLAEVVGRRVAGERGRRRVVAAVEVARAACKLFLVAQQHQQQRMPMQGGGKRPRVLIGGGQVSSRVGAVEDEGAAGAAPAGTQTTGASSWWRGRLSGLAVPLPAGAADALFADAPQPAPTPSLLPPHWASTPLTPSARLAADAVADPRAVASYPSVPSGVPAGTLCDESAAPLFLAGEVLFALRPLVLLACEELIAARRRAAGERERFGRGSWLALLLSVLVDSASARCTQIAAERAAGNALPLLPSALSRLLGTLGGAAGAAVAVAAADGPRGAPDAQALLTSPLLGPMLRGFSRAPSAAPDEAFMDVLGAASGGGGGGGGEGEGSSAGGGRTAALLLRAALWTLSGPPGLSAVEDAELQRRRMGWLLYLLRRPLYRATTAPAADRVAGALGRIPLVGSMAAYGRDVLAYLSAHHFYTSGSA
jgi:hypothetical protein